MAKLIHSSDVLLGSRVSIDTEPIVFQEGRNIGSLPTLYDERGDYVDAVNQWFMYLRGSKRLDDLSSYSRALLRYWTFIENEGLEWDQFPKVKSLKPTYRFRNDDLLKNAKAGNLAFSTANTYIRHVVQFYLWAAHECLFKISNEHKPFEIEFISVKTSGVLAHMMPKFTVRTSDLRIRLNCQLLPENLF